MEISRDYEDLFRILNGHKIKYLVVGAYAVMFYSEPRYTKDIDIWIDPGANDAPEVHSALKEFGAPLKGVSPDDFSDSHMILQIGVAPVRIDIIMGLEGISFQTAWRNRKRTRYGKTAINIMGISELIETKKRAGRDHDKLDLKRLLEVKKEKE